MIKGADRCPAQGIAGPSVGDHVITKSASRNPPNNNFASLLSDEKARPTGFARLIFPAL